MTLTVTRAVIAGIVAEAARAAPEECCGLLLGGASSTNGAIGDVLPAKNVAADRRCRFEIDPAVLLAAHKAARTGGPAVLGHYHSHPLGQAEPSIVDRAEAPGDGRVWAIVAGDQVTFWRDSPDGFAALPYRVADG